MKYFWCLVIAFVFIGSCRKKEEAYPRRSDALADSDSYYIAEYKVDGVNLLDNTCGPADMSSCTIWRTDTSTGYDYTCYSDYFATNKYYLNGDGRNRLYFLNNHKFKFEWAFFEKVEVTYLNGTCSSFYSYKDEPIDYIQDFDYEAGFWEFKDRKTLVLNYDDGRQEVYKVVRLRHINRNILKLEGTINGRKIEIICK